jgi:hypothetical protein
MMKIGRKKQAMLPASMEEFTLDSMDTGDVVYTVPWAMWVDQERRCWLHPKYTAHHSPGGTVQMRVQLQEDGYHVWLVNDHRYSPSGRPGFMSPTNTEYLPVAELHEEDRT